MSVACASVVVVACSGGAGSDPGADGPTTVTSTSGALRIAFDVAPQPAIRGTNSVELRVTSASTGEPVDGLTVHVTPWMPAMDHGSSTATVTPQGGGVYLVRDVYLYMPGTWVLKTSFGGSLTDDAAPTVSVQ